MTGAVVLLSGGMDSATLLGYVRRNLDMENVYALSVHYGQKHGRELEMARWQAKDAGVKGHRVVDLGFFAGLTAGASSLTDERVGVPDLADLPSEVLDQPSTYVPNRNMVLLSLAAAHGEALGVQDVFYGAQAQDRYGYWDCTTEFVAGMNTVLGLNRRKPTCIHAPFVDWAKSDVLRTGLDIGVDYAHTWTCYRGQARPCLNCPSCVERASAFEAVGLADPLLGGD